MDRLSALATFVSVVDQRGFAAAARKLRISPSVATRQVAGLEERLGVRLLSRTTRSVVATEAGARLLERARRILSELEEAEESARAERTSPSGKLLIHAPLMFGRMHVGPVLASYLVRYPAVTAELQLNDRVVNLVDEGVDLAVRIGELGDSTLVARKVGATRRVLVASPRYLSRAPPLISPEDLPRHPLIAFTPLAPGREWRFPRAAGPRGVEVHPRLATNSGEAAIGFALQHGGLTLALGYQVADAVSGGRLSILLPDFEPPPLPIHLVFPSHRLLSAKVRAFVELVTRTCKWDFTRLPGPGRSATPKRAHR